MANLQLTFPVFYHCAVKKASPYPQYKVINLLLTGSLASDVVPESAASLYANGTKPLPKGTIYDLLQLSDQDLYDRFQALNFSDIFVSAEALARLLEVVSISPSAKAQLLRHNLPEKEYEFLIQVFRAALKNSTFHTVRLNKEDLTLIQSCREPVEEPVPQTPEEPAPQTPEAPAPDEEHKDPSSLLDRLKDFQPIDPDDLEKTEPPVRNIGSLRPAIEHGKTDIAESYLKFMAELNESNTNPLDPLGDYTDQLLIRTLFPSAQVSRKDLLDAFYSLIDSEEDDGPPLIALDYADLMSVVQDADAEDLFVLECMGREEEVLHYLTRQPSLSGVKRAAMVCTLSTDASFELANDLAEAVMESMGHDMIFIGVRLSMEIGEGQACVRLILAC